MDSRFGILVAVAKAMSNICHHCDEPIVGTVYRVTSEADGVPLLNMVVCASCANVAKNPSASHRGNHTGTLDAGGAH